MTQPEEVMKLAWGPFARQCATTRTSHYEMVNRSGPRNVDATHVNCIGFVSMSAGGDAVEVTASTDVNGQSTDPVLYRVLREPNGITRIAQPGDNGLLAQGSSSTLLTRAFAQQIGLTRRQIINPDSTLQLPIVLYVPAKVDGTLQCRPDGGGVDHGRKTLVFSCTADQQVRSNGLDARLRLAGVEEVDVLTGVRLSGSLAGSLRGSEQPSQSAVPRRIDDHIWYERTMEFE